MTRIRTAPSSTILASARPFAGRQRKLAAEGGREAPNVLKLPKRRWEAGYQDNLGRWKTKRFGTKAEAEDFLGTQKKAIGNGTYVDPSRAEKTTVGMFYDQWIAQVRDLGANGRRAAKPKTIQDYEWIYVNHIAPTWQDFPLANVDYQGIGAWVRSLERSDGTTASADARKRAADQFSRMMKFAVARRLLSFNPALDPAGIRGYVPATRRERKPVYLTRAQLDRLALCSGPYELLVRFTGLTGLRWGEVTALLVQDLDLGDRPVVSVNKAFSEVKGQLVLGTTKGHEEREVPLSPSLASELRQYVRGKAATQLLFASAERKPMRNSNFTRRYYNPAKSLACGSVS
ncbi:tyrosine-type recombinase/integrase [Sinomonas sp. B1-1]|uniref:tyrosine-type recombinase/integrase n=1 Tax=Sinomonas sp. B1-1 TaxID=3141454 RepID=UPI003D2A1F98